MKYIHYHMFTERIPPHLVVPVAKLFVTVDAHYGTHPWWHDVRTQGLPAAQKSINQNWWRSIVAQTNNSPVGFAALTQPVDNKTELVRVMTHPDMRRQHIATTIIQKLLCEADTHHNIVWLSTYENDINTIRFYEQIGFVTYDKKLVPHTKRQALLMKREHPTIK